MAYALIAGYVLVVSFVGSYFTMLAIDSWYQTLNMPAITPSGAVIGGVWTVLYILLAIAGILYWKSKDLSGRSMFLGLFIVNGILNVLWSYIFFGSQNISGAFIEIWILNVSVLSLIWFLWPRARVAAYLLIPYFLWVSFATYLNYLIKVLN